MLDRVNLYLFWQFYLVGPWGDGLDNLVGSNMAVVQFTAWSMGNDVLRIELYPILFLERRGGNPLSISTFTVTVLGSKDLCLNMILDFLQFLGRLVCVSLCRDRRGSFALSEVELPLRVIAVVGEKGGYACRFRSLVVCREFEKR
jgi:hypothetical protein